MTQQPPPSWPPPPWPPAPPQGQTPGQVPGQTPWQGGYGPWPPQQQWPQQWQPPAKRPRHPRFGWHVALGVAVGALLLSGIGGAISLSHKGSSGPATGTLAADVPQLEAFVAKDRGLAYVRKVKVIVMSRKDLTAYADKNAGVNDVDRAEAAIYQALGLIDDADAYVQHLQVEQSADIGGLYENGTDTIRVAAEEANPYTRSVLAHELTHALDDQHFPLSKVQDKAFAAVSAQDPDSDDTFFGTPLPDLISGLDGLLEGDAERVRDDYLAQLSPSDQALELQEEQAAGDAVPFDDDDATLAPIVFLPYVDGVTYTRALLKQGGQTTLDAAFADPPTTSQAVLHPGQSFGATAAPDPAKPSGSYLATGSMGEAGLAVVLGEVSDDGDVRSTLAQAWRSDRVAVSRDGAKACADWDLTLSGSVAQIAAGLRQQLPDATVTTAASGVSVESCR